MALTKKQKEVLDYIKHYHSLEGIAPTQKEIKEHFGLKSFGSVQRYLKYLIEGGHLAKDVNATRGIELVSEMEQDQLVHSPNPNALGIPLLGQIAAGTPILAVEQAEDVIQAPAQMINPYFEHFALRVNGDSMIEDGILDQDLVFIRKQTSARPGQTIAALVDEEATLKKYFPQEQTVELVAANSKYDNIVIDRQNQQFHILGIMVGLIRTWA